MATRKLNPIFNYDNISSVTLPNNKGILNLPLNETQIGNIDISTIPTTNNDIYIQPHYNDDDSWGGNAVQAVVFNNFEKLFFDIASIIGEYDISKYTSIGEYINSHSTIINSLTSYNNTLNTTTKSDIMRYKKVRGFYVIHNVSITSGVGSIKTSIELDGTTNKYTTDLTSTGFYLGTSRYTPIVWICYSSTRKPVLTSDKTSIICGKASRDSVSPYKLTITFYKQSTIASESPTTATFPDTTSIDIYVPYVYNFWDDQSNGLVISSPLEQMNFITADATHTHLLSSISNITATASEINVLSGISAGVTTNKINDICNISLTSSRLNEILSSLDATITSSSLNTILTSLVANAVKGSNISKIVQPLSRRGFRYSNYLKVSTWTLSSTALSSPQYFRHGTGTDEHVMILAPYSNTNSTALIYTINPVSNNVNKIKFPNGSQTPGNYTFKVLIIPSSRYFDTYAIPCGSNYYHNFGNTNYFVAATYPDIDPDDLREELYPNKHLYISNKTSTYCTVTSPDSDDTSMFDPAVALIDSSWVAESGSSSFNDSTGVTISLTQNLHQTDPNHPEVTSSKTLFIEIVGTTTNMTNYWIEAVSEYSFKIYSSGLNGISFNWFVPKILSEMEGTSNGEIL